MTRVLSCERKLIKLTTKQNKTTPKIPLWHQPWELCDGNMTPHPGLALAWQRHQGSLPWAFDPIPELAHLKLPTCLVRSLGLQPQMLLETQWSCLAHWPMNSHDPCSLGPILLVESNVRALMSRVSIRSSKCGESYEKQMPGICSFF